MSVVIQILSSVSNIMLPFGFTFGAMIVFVWSIPILMRLFKSIFQGGDFLLIVYTIRDCLIAIMGEYAPLEYIDDEGIYRAYEGIASLDWSYIFACVILVVFLYCILRIVGGLICK